MTDQDAPRTPSVDIKDYSWMKSEHAAEVVATARAIHALRAEDATLAGDALLNAASERAGYDFHDSGVEMCYHCGALYHTYYGSEYVDPDDHDDLLEILRVTSEQLLTVKYEHFCDLECLRAALRKEQGS